jgi:hypothetical protein
MKNVQKSFYILFIFVLFLQLWRLWITKFFSHLYSLRKPFLSSNHPMVVTSVMYGYLDPNVRIGDFRSRYKKPEWFQMLRT